MRIKRFIGKDLPSVVNQIKGEFGLKAIILSQRDKPEGQVEVTAGVRDEDLAPEGTQETGPGSQGSPERDEAFDGIKSAAAVIHGFGDQASFDEALELERCRELPLVSALGQPRAKDKPSLAFRGRPLRPVPEVEGIEGSPFPPAGKVGPAPDKSQGKPQVKPLAKAAPKDKVPDADSQPGGPAPKPKAPPVTAPALGAEAYRKTLVSSGTPAAGLSVEREIVGLREYVAEEFTELKTLFLDLAHRQSLAEKWRDRPEVVGLYRSILGTGLSPEWARDFAEKAAESKDAWGGELAEHLRKTVKPRLRCLSLESPLPRLLALTGPTGAGKTTSLVRLAAWYQKKGRKVSAITLDTLKLGAVEQLTQYARIMGLGVKACQNKEEFVEANEIFQDSDLVLVDTNTRDFAAKGASDDLSAALMGAGAKRLLVLPAGLKIEDLDNLHRATAGPTLLGLVLTKLDETLGLGNVMGFLAGNGPSLCFFSVGPRTPEDFLPANPDKLLDYWLSPNTARKPQRQAHGGASGLGGKK